MAGFGPGRLQLLLEGLEDVRLRTQGVGFCRCPLPRSLHRPCHHPPPFAFQSGTHQICCLPVQHSDTLPEASRAFPPLRASPSLHLAPKVHSWGQTSIAPTAPAPHPGAAPRAHLPCRPPRSRTPALFACHTCPSSSFWGFLSWAQCTGFFQVESHKPHVVRGHFPRERRLGPHQSGWALRTALLLLTFLGHSGSRRISPALSPTAPLPTSR